MSAPSHVPLAPEDDPLPEPGGTRNWTMPTLSRAIDGCVVFVSGGGEVEFVSDSSSEILGTADTFEQRWAWMYPHLEAALERARATDDGEATLDIDLPDELGGDRFFVRVLDVDEEEDDSFVAVVKPRSALDALQADLRLASQMRRLALAHQQAAHDIRAPLNAIGLNLDLVRQQLAETDDAEFALERIGIVKREVSRLTRMIQMVVSQSGVPRESVRRFDLRRLVREVISLVRPQARNAKVRLTAQMASEAVPVLGARDLLKQAVVNLVMNGLEAMPDGGALHLTVTRGETHTNLSIQDTGGGIPADVLPKVFKLHFTTKSTGTGIGLFTSRATIQTMGGSLELVSDDGVGTTARVVLPLAGFEPQREIACSTS